jgi:hypothetical protein
MHNGPLGNTGDARRTPWNKGKLIGSKPPLRTKDVWSIRPRIHFATSRLRQEWVKMSRATHFVGTADLPQ